ARGCTEKEAGGGILHPHGETADSAEARYLFRAGRHFQSPGKGTGRAEKGQISRTGRGDHHAGQGLPEYPRSWLQVARTCGSRSGEDQSDAEPEGGGGGGGASMISSLLSRLRVGGSRSAEAAVGGQP